MHASKLLGERRTLQFSQFDTDGPVQYLTVGYEAANALPYPGRVTALDDIGRAEAKVMDEVLASVNFCNRESDLVRAIAVCNGIQKRIDELEGPSCLPVPNINWSPTTLAVMIGDVCVWEDQNCNHDDLTVDACLSSLRQDTDGLRLLSLSPRIFMYDELRDAWEGEGNTEKVGFQAWVEAMADNPKGTLRDAAREYLNKGPQ